MAAALVLCSVTLAAPRRKRQLIENVPFGEWYFAIDEALNPRMHLNDIEPWKIAKFVTMGDNFTMRLASTRGLS
jgi:hypothetical protein